MPGLMARYVRALAENECPFLPAALEGAAGLRYAPVPGDDKADSDSDGGAERDCAAP